MTALDPAGQLPLRAIVDAIDGVGRAIDDIDFYLLSLRTVEATAGPRHPLAGHLHAKIAQRHYVLGDEASALRHALEAEDILLENLHLGLDSLSEVEVRRMVASRETTLELILSIAVRSASGETRSQCWDAFMRGRTIVVDEMASRRRTVAASGDTTLIGLAAALADAKARLAALSFVEPAADGSTALALRAARGRRDSLERAIARLSGRYRGELAWRDAGLAEVRRQLAPDEALIAYACYRPSAQPGARTRSASYKFLDKLSPGLRASAMAFVIRGDEAWPAAIELGPLRPIDEQVTRWRACVERETAAGSSDASVAVRLAGDSLRKLIWDPIGPHVSTLNRIYVVFDGTLQRISLDPLPVDPARDAFLAETLPTVHYLDAERDLLHRGGTSGLPCTMAAIGGIDYTRLKPPQLRRGSQGCNAAGGALSDLPASGQEVAEILRLWQSSAAAAPCAGEALIGERATEGRLKSEAPRRSVLHLSLHGFFIDCAGPSETDGRSPTFRSRYLSPPASGEDDLMMRTGLVLEADMAPAIQDGLLTAEELSGLDLSGVRLVVMSACETGLGIATTSEGMFGLRRALAVSGSTTQVLSLWPVGDSETAALMRVFYRELLTGRIDVATALRRAGLEILGRLRAAGLEPSPAVWSPFVAVGPENHLSPP